MKYIEIIALLLCIALMIIMVSSIIKIEIEWRKSPDFAYAEQPKLYYKDIDVEIIDIDKRTWYAGIHNYQVKLTVKSYEYNLTEDFTYTMRDAMDLWKHKKGDILKARLYSWVMKSTGEVVRREIYRIIF